MTDMPEPPIFIDGSETDPKEIFVFSDGMDKSISLRPNKYFVQYTRTDTILVDHVDKADAWDACTERKPPQVKVKPLVDALASEVVNAAILWEHIDSQNGITDAARLGALRNLRIAVNNHDAAILSAIEGEG